MVQDWFFVPDGFSWLFMVPGWLFMIPSGFLLYLKVSGLFFMVSDGLLWYQDGFMVIHGYSLLSPSGGLGIGLV